MIPTDTDLEAQFTFETEAVPIPEDPPFYILFLGDYSGRENQSQHSDLSSNDYKIYEIDRDNFEDIMKRLSIKLYLNIGEDKSASLLLNFNEIDDFHPDRIFQQISIFSELRKLRQDLLEPDTFESAARQVRAWADDFQSQDQENMENQKNTDVEMSSGNLLDDVISGKKAEKAAYSATSADSLDLNSFIRDIVKPHIVRTDESEQAELLAVVDEATSSLMRKILHHPQFKDLESAWRGLHFVVYRTETTNDLKLFLLDLSKNELVNDLKSVNDLSDSKLFNKIVLEKSYSHDGEPFALICGNYEFELDVEDTATLIRLAKIGSSLNAPFISQIKPRMLGIENLSDRPSSFEWNFSDDSNEGKLWTMLRTFNESPSLGLALPRFMIRLPYGKSTDPTEVFSFEEFNDYPEHDKYLWANPSYAFALLLAQTFRANSWEIGNRFFNQIDNLPVHHFQAGDETKSKSCAEAPLNHEACNILIEQGLMPIISFRDTDSINFADFQSISFPSKPLQGRWS